MAEEKTEKNKQEAEIVTLDDFEFKNKSNYKRLLRCPKCESSAICLDSEFAKNNLVNSLEEKDVLKKVLKCVNCNYKDLAAKFLQEVAVNFSPIWSNTKSNVFPIKKYPSISPSKKYQITTSKNKLNPLKLKYASLYKKRLRGGI